MNDNLMPATTRVYITCPNCADTVMLPLVRVDVAIRDTIENSDGTVIPLSLTADLEASGRHVCGGK